MSRSTIFAVLLISLLICFSSFSVGIRPVRADPRTIVVPDDYPTIQAAIDNANNGDTVYVKDGTYSVQSIIINKAISLLGQDMENTVIQGVPYDHTLIVQGNNVTIEGFTVSDGFFGCRILGSGCLISNNTFTGNDEGISVEANGNIVSNNLVTESHSGGIVVFVSDFNTIANNTVQSSCIGVDPFQADNNTISGNNITNNDDAGLIFDGFSSYNIATGNNISDNGWYPYDPSDACGIKLMHDTDSNQIVNNYVSSNQIGLVQDMTGINEIYHNSFINNQKQVVQERASVNVWDNGYPSGGNYWSDYNGTDMYSGPYQNLTGSDGIGDTPYIINGNNIDHYPLMKPWTGYDIAVMAVSTDCNWVYQGQTANISVTVLNDGDFTENVTVTLYYNITADQVVDTQNITLLAGEDETLLFVWNTMEVTSLYVNYTLTAVATTFTVTSTLSGGNIMVRFMGDINDDGKVDIKDLHIVALAYGSSPGDPNWNPAADVNHDGKVDIRDVALVAKNFGEHS